MIRIVLLVVILVLAYVRPRALALPPGVLAKLPLFAPVPPAALSVPAPWRPATARPVPAWRATVALGGMETRRLLRSPLVLVTLVFAAVNVAVPGRRDDFTYFNAFALAGPAALWCGLLCFFAGNLAATRARRSGAEEVVAPAPVSPRLRVLAHALAALVVGAAFFAVFLAGWVYWWDVRDVALTRPGIGHLLSVPVQVVGGITLGVMVATWAPFRGVAPVVFVALVTAHIQLADHNLSAWGAFLEYVRWPDQGGGFLSISAAWHTTYLLLLSAMAVVGALVWLPGRRRGLLALGALVTLAAFGAGLAQHQ